MSVKLVMSYWLVTELGLKWGRGSLKWMKQKWTPFQVDFPVKVDSLFGLLAGGTSSLNLSPLAGITLVQQELGVHLEAKIK